MRTPESNRESLLKPLLVPPEKQRKIEKWIMYSIFQVYVNTEVGEPINTFGVGEKLPTEFKGNDLVCAAYIFGAIEQETQKGENFSLLDNLKKVSIAIFHSTQITLEQFETTCSTYTRYYFNQEKSPYN